jgi:hypothetical protein
VNRLTALMNAEELISSTSSIWTALVTKQVNRMANRRLWAVDHNLTQNPWWICQLQTLGHSIYLFSDKDCSGYPKTCRTNRTICKVTTLMLDLLMVVSHQKSGDVMTSRYD